MVPCLQSCKSLGDVSELLWWETRTGGGSCDSSCMAVMGRTPFPGWGIIWVPHGYKGREAEHFTSGTFTLTRVRQGWPLHSYFWDSHNFVWCQKSSLLHFLPWDHPMRHMGSHSWCWSQCWVRRAFVPCNTDRCAREAEQAPIEFSQNYITPNGSGSSPLHHSPVNEISWLLLASDESICQPHKCPSSTPVL